VFIITADHTSTNQTPEHQSYRGKYLVPLLMYAPSYFAPRQQSSLVQHIDISTTIKHIAGAPSDVSFGKSLLDTASQSIVHYDGSIYVCTNDSFTLEWNGASSVKLYKYKEDPKQLTDVSDSYVRETEEMLNELKMSIQKYNYRLLNNYFQ